MIKILMVCVLSVFIMLSTACSGELTHEINNIETQHPELVETYSPDEHIRQEDVNLAAVYPEESCEQDLLEHDPVYADNLPCRIDFITLENGLRVDSRMPNEVINLVIRHFESIDNGDLAVFITALGAHDAQDKYRNMAIIYRYFGNLMDIEYEVINHAIVTGENISYVYRMMTETCLPSGRRYLGMNVSEIHLHPYMGDWIINVVTINEDIVCLTFYSCCSKWIS